MGEGRLPPHFAEEENMFCCGEADAALTSETAGILRAALGEILPLSRAA